MQEKRSGVQKYALLACAIFLVVSVALGSVNALPSFLETLKNSFLSPGNLITGKATSGTSEVNITVSNSAPVVRGIFPSPIAAQSITEFGTKNLTISFLVDDDDGTGNIDDTTARANITIENVVRVNNSCFAEADVNASRANYTCTFNIWYFDTPGNITLNVTAADLNNARSVNGTNFTLNPTLAITVVPSAVAFPSIAPGTKNTTSNNDPIYVNNTGNQNVTSGNVRVQAFTLVGQTTASQLIPAANFSVGVNTAAGNPECNETVMANATTKGIINSILGRGNNTAAKGIQSLYACLADAPAAAVLSSQVYSASGANAWVVSVV